jgi:hypothetical protein
MRKNLHLRAVYIVGGVALLLGAQSPVDAKPTQPRGFQINAFTGCGIPGSDPRGNCARAGTEADLNAAFARCRVKPTSVVLATDGVKAFMFDRVRLTARLSACLKAQIPKDIQANAAPMAQ